MTAKQLKDVEAETQNEIDEILDEVEQLRRELNEGTPDPLVETPAVDAVPPTPPSDEDLMKEFHASFGNGEEGAMETALADLPERRDDFSVKSLLDQTLEDQAERTRQPTPQPIANATQKKTNTRTPSHVEAGVARNAYVEAGVARNAYKEPTVKVTSEETIDAESGEETQTPAQTLTLTLTGTMVLKLRYDFGGQEVTVGFSNDTFRIELTDGTELTVPVDRKKTLRRVA